jgi:hypothetical protein
MEAMVMGGSKAYVSTFVLGFARAWAVEAQSTGPDSLARDCHLKMFLDCDDEAARQIRHDVDFAEYVDQPEEADVHVRVVPMRSVRGYKVELLGVGAFNGFHTEGVVGSAEAGQLAAA